MEKIDSQEVIRIHNLILSSEPGLHGDHGIDALEGALYRITTRIEYEGLVDVFEIAAMYAVALARGHVFNDANKRTALVTALTYLGYQGCDIQRSDVLEEIMVDVAEGGLSQSELARLFYSLAVKR
jgi:death-on-curing protein